MSWSIADTSGRVCKLDVLGEQWRSTNLLGKRVVSLPLEVPF